MQRSSFDDLHPTIVHLHIFKNAGTSIDRIFQDFFGPAFCAHDLPTADARIGVAQIGRFLHDNPGCRYLTSHQIGLPLPVYERRLMFPLVMLRDPFERVPSCFFFERDKQRAIDADLTLEEYVRRHLDVGRVTATIGIQLLTLTDGRLVRDRRLSSLDGDAEDAARRALLSLPVFGLVERFGQSLADFAAWFERFFPDIGAVVERRETRANVGASPDEARGDARRYLRETLSGETFGRLQAALAPELRLYETARAVFEERAR